MHQHHAGHQHVIEKRQNGNTVIQYVYKTAAPTFDGPIGGYSTVNPPATAATQQSSNNGQSSSNNNNNNNNNNNQQQQDQASAAAASSSAAAAAAASSSQAAAEAASSQQAQQQAQQQATSEASPAAQPSQTQAQQQQATSAAPAATSAPQKAAVASQNVKPVTASSSETSSSTSNSLIAQIGTPTSSPTPAPSSGGMSGGAKAGVAFGVLFGIAALAALAFLLYRRKRRNDNEAYVRANDEKFGGGLARAQSTMSTRTTATAPRLSLRPVTQFLPDLAARGKAANVAGGAGLAGAGAGAAAMSRGAVNEKANPFGNHAEMNEPSKRISDVALPIQNNSNENPFGNHAEAAPAANGPMGMADAPAPLRIRTPSPEAAAVAAAGAGALAGAGAMAAAKHRDRRDAPKELNLGPNQRAVSPGSQSPASSDFSSQAPASPGMVNGPPPTNVHRIQLDFKPSMDDELGLRAGSLVRLLHEYDDGWVSLVSDFFAVTIVANVTLQALCIRLDRSQQGVAPRTCLSARPVKPRPPPGARGPRGPPQGMMGPGQQRPASPASGRGSPTPYGGRAPRPMGPNGSQQRSMSPGPYGGGPSQRPAGTPMSGKRRSNSASDLRGGRNSPPGPSRMNPNIQRIPMQQQAIASPDGLSAPSTPTVGRKPVPGQAM